MWYNIRFMWTFSNKQTSDQVNQASGMQLLSDQVGSEDATQSLSLSEPKEAVGNITEQAGDPVIACSLRLLKIPDSGRCSSQYLKKQRVKLLRLSKCRYVWEGVAVILTVLRLHPSFHPSKAGIEPETFLLWSTLSHTRVVPGSSLTSNSLPISNLPSFFACFLHHLSFYIYLYTSVYIVLIYIISI